MIRLIINITFDSFVSFSELASVFTLKFLLYQIISIVSNKALLVQNLGIFVFSQNFAIRDI